MKCCPPMCQNQFKWPHRSSPFSSAALSPARAQPVSHWIAACVFAFSLRARRTASSCSVLRIPAATPAANAQVVIRMRMPGRIHLAAGVELFGRECADRLEQRIALARAHHAHQALLDQRVEFVERAVALAVAVADLLHRFERPAFVEAREPAQQQLFRRVEQRVAPADRRAQRALAEREVAIARRQQVERMIEPLQQRGGLEHAHPRRGQLERQRQAVELPADRGDRRCSSCR